MKKCILVTGSAGFLGSHLVEYHLSRGDIVYGIDNFSSSLKDSKHHHRLKNNCNYFFVEGDICSQAFIDYVATHVFKTEFDLIYNFACPASPPRYQEIPIETMLTCVVGTNNIINLAKQKTVIVHASTSEVYGDPTISPQPESYRGHVNSYGPRSCYDEGKRAAEALCYDYYKKGVDVRLVRIFNTYGTHMQVNDGRVVTNFIKQALLNEPITIYGSGLQTRSFCYVDDLIGGITSVAKLKNNPNTPINLGSPNEFTILELAKHILKLLSNCTSKLEIKDMPIDDPLQRKPDITLANKLLSWEPNIHLQEGLIKTISYIKEEL